MNGVHHHAATAPHASHVDASPNLLLSGLPDEAFDAIAPDLTFRRFRSKEILHRAGEPIKEVYFPGRGLYAITTMNDEGSMIEVAGVGREGFLGIGAVLGSENAIGDTVVELEAEGAHVMSIAAFQREFQKPGPFRDTISRYTRAFVASMMQSVACNGLHSAEARCCRWLLDACDRLESSELAVTHEEMGMLLGLRRPTVTLVMSELARGGILTYARGRIRILDRQRLESLACECYERVKGLNTVS